MWDAPVTVWKVTVSWNTSWIEYVILNGKLWPNISYYKIMWFKGHNLWFWCLSAGLYQDTPEDFKHYSYSSQGTEKDDLPQTLWHIFLHDGSNFWEIKNYFIFTSWICGFVAVLDLSSSLNLCYTVCTARFKLSLHYYVSV